MNFIDEVLKDISNLIPDRLIQFTGDVHLSKYPMFIQYKPSNHKIKGASSEYIRSIVEPCDILLRRFDNYLNTIFTPGFWGHAGAVVEPFKINIGDSITVPSVIHALGNHYIKTKDDSGNTVKTNIGGVKRESVLDFCRCDSVCVIRLDLNEEEKEFMLNKLYELEGNSYDYEFESGDNEYYCTELVNIALNGKFDNLYKKKLGNYVLLPDPIREYYNNNVIFEEIN